LALSGCDLAVSVVIAPEILTVCPSGCDYTSIQEAIAAASPYQVIEVQTGGYRESLLIAELLILKGAGADVTAITGGSKDYPTITIIAGEVVISGFSITGEHHGIKVEGNADVTIRDCQITGNALAGVIGQDRAQIRLEGSDISGNEWGIFAKDHSSFTAIGGNILFNRCEGILLWEAAELTLMGVDVSFNGGGGIWASDYTWLILENCVVDFNRADGVLLAGHVTAHLEENRIAGNEGWGVAAYEWPCHMTKESFSGTASGRDNQILDWWEENGNERGAPCGVPWWLKD